jgi:hypothetical protein
MESLTKILQGFSQQDEKFIILPSGLEVSEKAYKDIKVLAQERFPSIPAHILEALAPTYLLPHLRLQI